MASVLDLARYRFIPLVTSYSISSPEIPFGEMVTDGKMLFERFRDYREKAGFDCIQIMGDSTYPVEAMGCAIGYKAREPFIAETLSITSAAEAEALVVPEVDCCARIGALLEAIRLARAHYLGEVPIIVNCPGPLSCTARALGMTDAYLNMVLDPGMIKALLDKMATYIRNLTDATVAAGADMLILPDPASSTNLISPAMFREFAFGPIREQVAATAAPIILHVCGKTLPIARDMVETGAAMISIDQQADITAVRKSIGDDVIIGGNMDPIAVLAGMPVDAVEAKARENFADGGESFILMPGCTITPDTPMENVRAMVNAAREMSAPAA